MANEEKMLPPNIRVDWIPGVDGISDPNAPTVAELEAGTNITCAITSANYTLGFTDRDTNSDKSLCDDSNVQTPIYKNYEGNLTFFRDADFEETLSVYNQAYDLFKTPRQYGWLVERVGYDHETAYESGQEVLVFYFQSGDPRTLHNDGEPVKMQVMFMPQGQSSDGIVEVVEGS